MASAPPFVMVVARQVGVPLGVQGVVSAVVMAAAVLVRPAIAALVDTFPTRRKIIFLALIGIMLAAYNPIGFLPPLQSSPHLSGQLMPPTLTTANPNICSLHFVTPRQQQQPLGKCMVIEAWDCFAFCQNHKPCPALSYHSSGFRLSLQPSHNGFTAAQVRNTTTLYPVTASESFKTQHIQELMEDPKGQIESSLNHVWEERKKDEDMDEKTWSLKDNQTMVYVMKGVDGCHDKEAFNLSIECQGGMYGEAQGDTRTCGPAVWTQTVFWVYVVLLLFSYITATSVESISDAVCCDTIGEGGNYGQQRVWGVLSYGLLGALSGLLVDWHSGDSTVRDYRPAFYLMTVCGILDLLLSATCLKVPKLEAKQTGVRANLGPLLRQIHFLIFLVTAFLIGLFDGLDTGFLFVLQEDIAENVGTSGQHVNMVQGLTLLVQALSAIPCMFLCDWFMRRLGSQKVISTVLFLYSLRLLCLAVASHLGVLWVTALVEVINGPCFGLGYTAIVVHASSLAPRGYSTTVQSVVGVCYGTLGYAGASFVGGLMYEVLGGGWLYLVTGAAAFFTWMLHLSYMIMCPPDMKGKDLEQAEMGLKDPVPHAVVGLDAAPLQSDQKEDPPGREIIQKEEEIKTLLEEKSPRTSVTEEGREMKMEATEEINAC